MYIKLYNTEMNGYSDPYKYELLDDLPEGSYVYDSTYTELGRNEIVDGVTTYIVIINLDGYSELLSISDDVGLNTLKAYIVEVMLGRFIDNLD